MATTDYTGQTLDGRYQIVKLLGEGGMGAVYLGRHVVIGKKVAVKILHADLAGGDEMFKRFYREAQAAAAIGHKNIIDVLDVGASSQGDPYMVMEYLEGEDLDNMLARTGPIAPAAACGIMEPILLALEAAHSKGIVHRDLKPANIFITQQEGEDPTVKLIDFGISKFSPEGGDQTKLTQTGTLLGTPAYMSPEQARSTAEVDRRTDIYAMGVIFYQMLTGALPFSGESYNDLLIKVLTEPHTPPSDAYPDFPTEAGGVIERTLTKDVDKRYQTASEMLHALEELGSYDRRRDSFTSFMTGIGNAGKCAGGDLGSTIIAKEDHPSATSVLSEMGRQATPGAWAGTSAKKPGMKVVFIGGGIAAVLLAIAAVFFFANRDGEPVKVPVQPAAPAILEKNSKTGVEITIKGAPDGAKIYYDNTPVPMNPFKVKKGDFIVPFRVEADGFKSYATSLVPSKDLVVEVSLDPVAQAQPTEPAVVQVEKAGSKTRRGKKKSVKKGVKDSSKSSDKITETIKVAPPSPAKPPAKKPDNKISKGAKGTLLSEDFE